MHNQRGQPPGGLIPQLQQALADAIERFQAMDEAGVLSHVSDHYRTDPLTKGAASCDVCMR
jgi:hypothetical protein